MKININKLYPATGSFFFIVALIFLLVHTSLVTKSPDEAFARDIFGFYIPTPPVWTSHIPYLGYFIGVIFEYFSLHGLVGLTVLATLASIGGFFLKLESKHKNKE